MGKPMEFSAAARENASRQVNDAADYYDNGVNGLDAVYENTAIDLQCQLNAAVELLRRLEEMYVALASDEECDGEDPTCTVCNVQDFLSHFPEGDKK